jgi:hypothetical protein
MGHVRLTQSLGWGLRDNVWMDGWMDGWIEEYK